jgi:hypothetical protein
MRRLMVLLLVALSCVLVNVATATPALACDRDQLPLAKALGRSEFVFSGNVAEVGGDKRTATYVVEVDRVWQGRVPLEVTVESPASRKRCGLTGVKAGDELLVVAADGNGDTVTARSFEGTRRLTAKAVDAATEEFGSAGKPVDTTPDPADEPLEMTVVDDSEPAAFGALALPGLLVAGLGLLTLAIAGLLSRRT